MEEERSVESENEDEVKKIEYKIREIAEPELGSAALGNKGGIMIQM